MVDFTVKDLRNIALIGHSGAGKTSLIEAMLFNAKVTTRMGSIGDGNTVCDFDDEEIRRGISINLALAPVEWNKRKLNLIDTPGYTDFMGEVIEGLSVADSALVVLDSVAGVEVGTELTWKCADERNLPRLAFVNRMERENADFQRVVETLTDKFGVHAVPLTLPIGSQSEFKGVVDLVAMRALMGAEAKPAAIPDNMQEQVQQARLALIEAAAEGNDDLLMKYLEGEELTADEIVQGLRGAILNRSAVPVLCGSAVQNIGVSALLDTLASFCPSPADIKVTAVNKVTGQEVELTPTVGGPLAVFVFKTIADPFIGKLTYFRVYSGEFQADSRVINARTGQEERVGPLYAVRGKEQKPIGKVGPGDIGAVSKLAQTQTGDTLVDKGMPLELKGITFPEPFFSVAISPKTKSDLDKLSSGLARLLEEDPSLRVVREPSTRETLLSGLGDTHVDVASHKLAKKFGVEIELATPKVPYRETISKVNAATYRHKKQTGGAGQFAEVALRVEPLERGGGFEFASEVFGGAISSSFFPSIEKGIKQVLETGVVAGYTVVDVKAVVYDGKEHPVDSKDIAFQIAGREAFKQAFMGANPQILEPIMEIEVTVPEQFMGDVLGDLNTRRARVQGMSQEKGAGVITALVPLAEIQRYATDLRSFTQGRGFFTMKLSHYEPVPAHLMQGIINAAKKEAEKEKE